MVIISVSTVTLYLDYIHFSSIDSHKDVGFFVQQKIIFCDSQNCSLQVHFSEFRDVFRGFHEIAETGVP